jgi:hypothetical protein
MSKIQQSLLLIAWLSGLLISILGGFLIGNKADISEPLNHFEQATEAFEHSREPDPYVPAHEHVDMDVLRRLNRLEAKVELIRKNL